MEIWWLQITMSIFLYIVVYKTILFINANSYAYTNMSDISNTMGLPICWLSFTVYRCTTWIQFNIHVLSHFKNCNILEKLIISCKFKRQTCIYSIFITCWGKFFESLCFDFDNILITPKNPMILFFSDTLVFLSDWKSKWAQFRFVFDLVWRNQQHRPLQRSLNYSSNEIIRRKKKAPRQIFHSPYCCTAYSIYSPIAFEAN